MGCQVLPQGRLRGREGEGSVGERYAKLNKRTDSRSREQNEMGASETGLDQELKVRGAHSEVTIRSDRQSTAGLVLEESSFSWNRTLFRWK